MLPIRRDCTWLLTHTPRAQSHQRDAQSRTGNAYDAFRSDATAPASFLCEESVTELLEVFIESDYGQTMFGRHEKCNAVGITGHIELCEIEVGVGSQGYGSGLGLGLGLELGLGVRMFGR